jgi:hypothetical protein
MVMLRFLRDMIAELFRRNSILRGIAIEDPRLFIPTIRMIWPGYKRDHSARGTQAS